MGENKKQKSTTAGFEPARAKPSRFLVCLLNHSDKLSCFGVKIINISEKHLCRTHPKARGISPNATPIQIHLTYRTNFSLP